MPGAQGQVDDFGAGLEVPNQGVARTAANNGEYADNRSFDALDQRMLQTLNNQNNQNTGTSGSPTEQPPRSWSPPPPTSNGGDLLSQVRNHFDVPEGWTEQDLVGALGQMWERSSKYDETQRQLAELQAQRAAEAAAIAAQQQQSQQGQQSAGQQQAQQPERQYRWTPPQVDPNVFEFVQRDPNTGELVPRNPQNGLHVAAAQEANRLAKFRTELTEAFYADPRGFIREAMLDELESQKSELAKWEEEWKKQFDPVQQFLQRLTETEQREQFATANEAKLYAQDGSLTPLGAQVDRLLRTGKFTPDEALAFAEEMTGGQQQQTTAPAQATQQQQQQPPTQQQPLTPAQQRRQQAQPQFKPRRLVDTVNERYLQGGNMPPNRNAYDKHSGGWRQTFSDLEERFMESMGQN